MTRAEQHYDETGNEAEYRLSKYVQVWQVNEKVWVMSHALNLNGGQIFGDARLAKVGLYLNNSVPAEALKGLYGEKSSALWNILSANRFMVDKKGTESVYDYYHPTSNNSVGADYRLLRVLLTDRCNLACDYCKVQQNYGSFTDTGVVSSEDLTPALGMFYSGSRPEVVKTIHTSGGEPLLYPDQVRQVISEAKGMARDGEQVKFVLGTNAIRMTVDMAKYLKLHDVKVIVSLDGKPDVHNLLRKNKGGNGSYGAVDKGLQIIRDYGIEYGLSCVVGRHNLESLTEQVEWMMDTYPEMVSLGINKMKPPTPGQLDYSWLVSPQEYVEAVYPVYKMCRERGVYVELVQRHLRPFCEGVIRASDCGAASGTTINVSPEGKIGPCKTGVITNSLSANGSNSSEMKETMAALKARSQLFKEICQICPAIGVCGNGCSYEAKLSCGDENGIDSTACEYTRLFHTEFMRDLADLIAEKIGDSPFYIPTEADRKLLYGNVVADPMTLRSSIGHHDD